jgi:hypothetical protein
MTVFSSLPGLTVTILFVFQAKTAASGRRIRVKKSRLFHSNWKRLRDLYEIARRRALHSEKVVSDLLASLERIA